MSSNARDCRAKYDVGTIRRNSLGTNNCNVGDTFTTLPLASRRNRIPFSTSSSAWDASRSRNRCGSILSIVLPSTVSRTVPYRNGSLVTLPRTSGAGRAANDSTEAPVAFASAAAAEARLACAALPIAPAIPTWSASIAVLPIAPSHSCRVSNGSKSPRASFHWSPTTSCPTPPMVIAPIVPMYIDWPAGFENCITPSASAAPTSNACNQPGAFRVPSGFVS